MTAGPAPMAPDVVVMGGGPGGCVAARDLARGGARVLLAERSRERTHLPETLTSGAARLLDSLAIPDWRATLLPEYRVRVESATSGAWITLTTGPREGSSLGGRLDRCALDALLLQEASSAGAHVLEGSTVTQVDPPGPDGQARVSLDGPDGVLVVPTPMVVDATGKSAFLSRSQGWVVEADEDLDPREALFIHVRPAASGSLTEPTGMTIVATGWGYVFVIPVTPERISVGVVIGRGDHPMGLGDPGQAAEVFTSALQDAPAVAQLIEDGTQLTPVIRAVNRAWTSARRWGSWFALVGDAAGFADPFLGNGLEVALTDGRAVAHFARQVLHGVGSANAAFQSNAAFGARRLTEAPSRDEIGTGDMLRALVDPHIPYDLLVLVHGGETGWGDGLAASRAAFASSVGSQA